MVLHEHNDSSLESFGLGLSLASGILPHMRSLLRSLLDIPCGVSAGV